MTPINQKEIVINVEKATKIIADASGFGKIEIKIEDNKMKFFCNNIAAEMKDKWTYTVTYNAMFVCLYGWQCLKHTVKKLECPHCLAMRQFEKVDSK